MHKIKTLLFATLITFSCKASTFNRVKPVEIKPLYEQIQRFINSAPEIKIYDEIIVIVKFKLNANNKIIIISDDSDNYGITRFIKTNLNFKQIAIANNNKNTINKIYSMPLRFISTVD